MFMMLCIMKIELFMKYIKKKKIDIKVEIICIKFYFVIWKNIDLMLNCLFGYFFLNLYVYVI